MVSTGAAGDAPTKQRNANTENTGAGKWGPVTHHKVQTCKQCLTMIGMNKTSLKTTMNCRYGKNLDTWL